MPSASLSQISPGPLLPVSAPPPVPGWSSVGARKWKSTTAVFFWLSSWLHHPAGSKRLSLQSIHPTVWLNSAQTGWHTLSQRPQVLQQTFCPHQSDSFCNVSFAPVCNPCCQIAALSESGFNSCPAWSPQPPQKMALAICQRDGSLSGLYWIAADQTTAPLLLWCVCRFCWPWTLCSCANVGAFC